MAIVTTTVLYDAQENDTTWVAAQTKNGVKNRSERQQESSPSNGTHCECEATRPADRSSEPPVKLEPPPPKLDTTLQLRTPLSIDVSGGEVHEVAVSHEGETGEGLKGGKENDDEAH
jgi:hypothetical protein